MPSTVFIIYIHFISITKFSIVLAVPSSLPDNSAHQQKWCMQLWSAVYDSCLCCSIYLWLCLPLEHSSPKCCGCVQPSSNLINCTPRGIVNNKMSCPCYRQLWNFLSTTIVTCSAWNTQFITNTSIVVKMLEENCSTPPTLKFKCQSKKVHGITSKI